MARDVVAQVPPALRAEGVVARYPGQRAGTEALRRVSLVVAPGERVLLLGPNGAGKTTLIRLLAGLMTPTAGSVEVNGHPARKARDLVGVVGHATYLYEELTVVENLRLYAELYDVADAARRVAELLEVTGLRPLAAARAGELSRGQQQRVSLARALVHDPPVLLLDEPETGLDVAAFRLLETLALTESRTVMLSTHNVAAGLRLADRAVVLARGQIVEDRPQVAPHDAAALTALLDHFAGAAVPIR